ncbi:NAD(+) diphosphatase [Gleimia sp. 6138-11-ORH1]|uniref:NAD(+) diphosphatase n=1 Tax=Gleimia sp. 6138-11-ORH1 TaxID=2973937 RepID=UPI002168C036|nr:NAD(+) diphosphatase [Gleimia sp. 6138-11-ORH1]MCS4483900.1 NAD(+) diphosphatase [Gleimia sp. 6138-11-ORH1]
MQIIPPLGAGHWEQNLSHATIDWQQLFSQPNQWQAEHYASFFVVDGRGNYWLPSASEVTPRFAAGEYRAVYLGSVETTVSQATRMLPQVVVFGRQIAQIKLPWTPIRDGKQLTPTQAQLYSAGNGLAAFHLEYRFCHLCGGKLAISEGGWSRTCQQCHLTVYPRQDPAVITAILDDTGRMLLAHNVAWPAGRVSLIAGYVNMGEAAEQTVAREIYEEVGLIVKPTEISYLTTQTWPFPRSLMLAYKVVLTNPPDPQADGLEISWARWYSPEEYIEAITTKEISGPVNRSVAAALVKAWLEGSL